jgi:hypothetical protein
VQRNVSTACEQGSEEKKGESKCRKTSSRAPSGIADRYDRTMSYWIPGACPVAKHCVGPIARGRRRAVSVHAIERMADVFELWVDTRRTSSRAA